MKPDLSKIHGRIKFVTVGANYTATELAVGGKLRVQRVGSHASQVGQWQIVGTNEQADYTIQLLPAGGQFTFTYVAMSPGVSP